MSHSHDIFHMTGVETGGSVRIETFAGDDEIKIGDKSTSALENFNVIGHDLNIDSGSEYDWVWIGGPNVVKDDVQIEAGVVGPHGSEELLTISGLIVGGYGVDSGRNDLEITSESHVRLRMTETRAARNLFVLTSNPASILEFRYVDVGRDFYIVTGGRTDHIAVSRATVGRDFGIASDNPWSDGMDGDYVSVWTTTVGRNMYVHTSADPESTEPSDVDNVTLGYVEIEGQLEVLTGGGDDELFIDRCEARSVTLNGGAGDSDHLKVTDSVFAEWNELDAFEDVEFT
jgi:hypothetical protein